MSHYDQFASDFSSSRQHEWPEFELIYPYIHPYDRVLDLGCGNARFRKFLPTDIIPEGYYFGLDISQKLLAIARENNPRDFFFHGDFSGSIPFGSDNFDMVVAIASFHHLLSKKEQLCFLSHCYRVMKNGGTIFLTTWKLPRKYFWSNILRGRFKNWIIPFGKDKHPRIYRRVSDSELRRLLKKVGFEVVKSELFRNRNYVVVGRK